MQTVVIADGGQEITAHRTIESYSVHIVVVTSIQREKIERLCNLCGGEHSRALFEVMTTRHSVTELSVKHAVSESVLYERRKAFYESWDKR